MLVIRESFYSWKSAVRNLSSAKVVSCVSRSVVQKNYLVVEKFVGGEKLVYPPMNVAQQLFWATKPQPTINFFGQPISTAKIF